MPFQIKDFASIVASQINHARGVTTKVTDFQPGSVVRTIMEAPAVEVEELYLQMFLGLRDAIPVATFLSFGFDRLPPARALGFVSVSVDQALTDPLVVPTGTVFTAIDGRSYTSTEEVTWSTSTLILRIPVASTLLGAGGNIAEGIINESTFFGDGFSVSNPAIATGRDQENDSEREARFAEFVAALSQGTVVACSYKAKQAHVLDADGNVYEYVTRLGVLEQAGYVILYIYSNRGIPSSALLADGQQRIDGKRDPVTGAVVDAGTRAAGIRFDVLPMVERQVPLAIQVRMLPGYQLTNGVRQRLVDIYSAAINQVQPGTTLYLGTMIDQLLGADGVLTIVPVTNSNIVCNVQEILIAGALTITDL